MVQAGQTSPCYDGDFYPFGGERIITNTCTQNHKFEGKERDTEKLVISRAILLFAAGAMALGGLEFAA